MAEQKIDAIKMTRNIRNRNYERLHNLSRAERLAFYREQTRLMNAKTAAPPPATSHSSTTPSKAGAPPC
jgi:hypothetical protein